MAKVSTFTTRVAGPQFHQEAISRCFEGQPVNLVRDPDNQNDKNAIEVWCGGHQIGFITRDEASSMAPAIDGGDLVEAKIERVIGGTPEKPITGAILLCTLTPSSLR